MRRHLFASATAISLLLCVATTLAWIRSYWRWDQLQASREWFESKRWTDRTIRLWSGRGGFNLGWSFANTTEGNVQWGKFPDRIGIRHFDHLASGDPAWPALSDEVEPGREKFGFAFGYADGFLHGAWRNGYQWEVVAPYIAPAILFAALPSLWAFKQIRRRNRHPPSCTQCGYNLTANTSGICPECGTTIVTPPDTASTTSQEAR